ncbi:hypothetical protein [Streptomyces sp. 891-h]|uniref:hypothetical protein n=1 Tax=Streptomyces sp. 891-h TaxID=2720714 RepID=UPI001FA97880|nr:hypothetical protein [Streptomyces sp. 891-h]UNZ22324.1 hypothetical protein HC362_34730 [Streptomyces sp. 891-h]
MAPLLDQAAPGLPATHQNLTSAIRAIGKITADGWYPRSAYPGSDRRWAVACRLCGWEGLRFYSHLRRGLPKFRHPGCLSAERRPEALAKVRSTLRSTCHCVLAHPVTPEEVRRTVRALEWAVRANEQRDVHLHLSMLVGACPAAVERAAAWEEFFDLTA